MDRIDFFLDCRLWIISSPCGFSQGQIEVSFCYDIVMQENAIIRGFRDNLSHFESSPLYSIIVKFYW